MDQKWFISSIFGIFCFLDFSNFFYVTSYALNNPGRGSDGVDSSALKSNRVDLLADLWENSGEGNGSPTEQALSEGAGENRKWLNVLAFDKLCNLTEKDKGPQNETKIIFINTEEHLKIFEDEDDEDEDKTSNELQEGREKNIFHLLSPEGFLSQIISEDQSKALERTKRQADGGKRRCRCRRKRRRGMARRRRRRRRRRNRTGQQRPARRRRRRRGRRRNGRRRGGRRCVCRKRGDGDGGEDEEGEEKSGDGEETEVEDADGEEEDTTEGGEETTTEEDGEEGDEGEEGEKGEEEGDDDEEEEEGSDEESDEEESDDEENAGKKPSPPEMGIPSAGSMPTYVIPYPNTVETPVFMIPSGGVPVGSYPTRIPTSKMPSYLAVGALLAGNSNSNTEK